MTYFIPHASIHTDTKSLDEKSCPTCAAANPPRLPPWIHRQWQIICLLAFTGCGTATAVDRLPALHAGSEQTSVSGISSGGYMAVQFHIAYSSIVKGAGVVAGGPFYCAQNDAKTAAKNCMQPDTSHPLPAAEELVAFTGAIEKAGAIDTTQNLKNSKIWLFSGRQDKLVKQAVMNELQRYYLNYAPATNIVYENTTDAGHAFPTVNFGGECSYNGPPFIDKCGIDGAGALLRHIYGYLNPPAVAAGGTLKEFDQREFFDGDAYSHSMRDSGFVYIPQACAQASCRVHVAFHGCMQNVDTVGNNFIQHTGYNEWADTNKLIIIYPQTISRYGIGWKFWKLNFVLNPQGCWDWWGYDSANYYKKDDYKKDGSQMRAVKKMIDRLASN